MTKMEEMQAETELLKAKLKEAVVKKVSPAEDTGDAGSDDGSVADKKAAVSAQFHEVLEEIGAELKEANPAVILGVFVLGMAVGRLFSR